MSNLSLVLVESPTKSKTLQKFLGEKYKVEATMGHLRDLPKGDFGVDVNNNFEPQYVIPRDKRKRVNELKKAASGAQTLFLATDPDREGEAIAWHISELLSKADVNRGTILLRKIKRVVFHEITEEAIKSAFNQPRAINLKLVDAQQARRVLDRLVGYKLSPLLWQKVKKGLSAGRVQSVALRLIVEREKEIKAFKAEEYWIIKAELSAVTANPSPVIASGRESSGLSSKRSNFFTATAIEQNGKKLEVKNQEQAHRHVLNLEKASYVVEKVTQKEIRRYPYPPFTTSTLQQTASHKLGMSAKKTMMVAQALYEHGLITYMRTDSVNLSTQAIGLARAYIENFIGKSYLPKTARIYKSKSKNVQEAHEAIRPTNIRLQANDLKQQAGFNRDHVRLYDLIRMRFVACQMSEAILEQTTVDVIATPSDERGKQSIKENDGYLLRATGSVIKFEGWLKLFGKEVEEEEKGPADLSSSPVDSSSDQEGKQVLPILSENQQLNLIKLLPTQHFTQPPPRYTEGSLIKKLEELGIGRPSTYAPTLSTIQDRFYVEKQERKFIPTSLGFTVADFLLKYFPDVIDYAFTAQMENELDEISRGEREWRPTMKQFYEPFEKKLEIVEKTAERVKMEVQLAGKKCPECGKELIIRIGKFGKFLACSGFPECKHTESLEEKVNAKCPQDGGEIVVRKTRRGKTFYGCKNWPVCKFASWTKPKANTPVIASPEGAKKSI